MLWKFCLVLLLQAALEVKSQVKNTEDNTLTATLDLLLEKIETMETKQREYEEMNRIQQLEIEMLKSQIQHDKGQGHLPIKNAHTFRMRRENESPVAFFGRMQGQHVNVSQNPILKFNSIATNIGDPYSQNNGLFIAPVAGIYVFSVTIMTETNKDAHVGIYVNYTRKTSMKLYGSAHMYDTTSQTAIFQLEKYDTVSVRHYEGAPILHYDYTSFAGFLLQEDYGQLSGSSIIG